MKKNALIIGAGPGISGSFAKELIKSGYTVCVASRNSTNLEKLVKSITAIPLLVDCSQELSINKLFTEYDKNFSSLDLVLYNPSSRVRGEIQDIDVEEAKSAFDVTVFGEFLVSQQAARRMIPQRKGAIFFTGATASTKGFAKSAVFAMGKFALRGLAQSLYRELSPLGIHVAHFIIDGAVRKSLLNNETNAFSSNAIAKTYMSILHQPKEAWTHEIELRKFTEPF